MNQRKEADELEDKKVDSSETDGDTSNREEEEIIELEDVVEAADETTGDILSDLEKENFDLDSEKKDSDDIDFESESKPDEERDADFLNDFFQGQKETPTKEATFKREEALKPEQREEAKTADKKPEGEARRKREGSLSFTEEELMKTDDEGESPRFGFDQEASVKEELSVEEIVDRLESRLMETIRRLVENRLPGVVRTVLREEIERLRKEFSDSSLEK